MFRRAASVLCAALLTASCAAVPLPLDPALKAKIDEAVRPAIASGKHRAIAVGILQDGRPHAFGYGRLSAESETPPDGETVFEIGSITKAFTGVLLSQMVEEGIVALDDPANKHLPPSIDVPARGDKEITILHLATHASGLPRMPNNFRPADPLNPYADYDVSALGDFLGSYALPRDPGAKYEYSNLAMGILGQLLAHKAKRSYEELVIERLAAPLGMPDTRITLSEDMKRRLAPGHDAGGRQVPNWDIPTFAGAGALRSTAEDMLRFLAGHLEGRYAASHRPLRKVENSNLHVGLGWHVGPWDPATGRTLVRHTGQTGGYWSFAGFVRESRIGVVVLANTARSVEDAGIAILRLLDRESGVK